MGRRAPEQFSLTGSIEIWNREVQRLNMQSLAHVESVLVELLRRSYFYFSGGFRVSRRWNEKTGTSTVLRHIKEDGGPEAWERFVHRYWRVIHGYAIANTRGWHVMH